MFFKIVFCFFLTYYLQGALGVLRIASQWPQSPWLSLCFSHKSVSSQASLGPCRPNLEELPWFLKLGSLCVLFPVLFYTYLKYDFPYSQPSTCVPFWLHPPGFSLEVTLFRKLQPCAFLYASFYTELFLLGCLPTLGFLVYQTGYPGHSLSSVIMWGLGRPTSSCQWMHCRGASSLFVDGFLLNICSRGRKHSTRLSSCVYFFFKSLMPSWMLHFLTQYPPEYSYS